MSNLIPQIERDSYISAIDDIHDTMGREIIIWQESTQTTSSIDNNYDAFYDKPNLNATYEENSKTFIARIAYIDKRDKQLALDVGSSSIEQILLSQSSELVRIKINTEANEYIKNARKVTIDGADFSIVTAVRPHGLFDINYFTYYLKSLE